MKTALRIKLSPKICRFENISPNINLEATIVNNELDDVTIAISEAPITCIHLNDINVDNPQKIQLINRYIQYS